MRERDCDVLIVGSGIAGLSLAIALAGRARIVVLTKKSRADSNTNYAQGGIAAVVGAADDPALHIADTLRAGAGLCHEEAVSLLVREGPERVRELIEWGARFNRVDGELALCREGGHSRPRIVYSGDSTGREIERALLARLARHPDVELFEDHIALELLVRPQRGPGAVRCAGAVALARETGEPIAFRAGATVLASGGTGRVYRHTTNPDIATGDGVAAAYRAGALVANLEFIQFHPTALFPAEDRAFLISEAVRGEGAVLRRPDDGRPLLEGHPEGSLATRDVVARAIDRMLHETGHDHALLDLSPIPADRIPDRFPVIFRTCLERGIDIRRVPIPVVPAAHYACGGVCTDRNGRTSLEGLYAAGEVACTGVHGANRLASNSLLEALVYSHRIARTLLERAPAPAPQAAEPAAELPAGFGRGDDPAAAGDEHLRELRELMWADAGIVRSDMRLARTAARLEDLVPETEAGYRARPGAASAELRNLAAVASLIVRGAAGRLESRGLHYNEDHPEPDARYRRDTLLAPPGAAQPDDWEWGGLAADSAA